MDSRRVLYKMLLNIAKEESNENSIVNCKETPLLNIYVKNKIVVKNSYVIHTIPQT